MKKKTEDDQGINLFAQANAQDIFDSSPLSVRMRPQCMEELVGQRHILAEGKLLPRSIEADRLGSIILYGPPGVGKTTLAHCISKKTEAEFMRINAVSANVDDVRKIIAAAKHRRETALKKTVLFIDEIHRFNKAQQDVLMPDLENGNLILIGATTLNPFFSLTAPLLSRSLIFELKPLDAGDVLTMLKRAISDEQKGLGKHAIQVEDVALDFLAEKCDGDARKALNALEIGIVTAPKDQEGAFNFTLDVARESIQKKQVVYDANGDAHYDVASAFIKSMRGTDPDAAVYWMAKMIYAGEDPRFIARRICICAAEDVGNADPQALVIANAALQTAEFVGLPEARIILAQAAIYVACAPKSNACYLAIDAALEDVRQKKTQEVPAHLKSSHSVAKKTGTAQSYKYAHDYEGHIVDQDYLSVQAQYYQPTEQGAEKAIKDKLSEIRTPRA